MKGKILMVVTSHERIDEDHPTGLWLEEFAVPYDRFRAEGFDVTVASPRGGATPVDPLSEPKREDAERWDEARRALRETRRTDEVASAPFAALFLPGGHGTMFDLPDDGALQDLIVEFLDAGKVVAAICHGPAALVNLRTAGGRPLVAGRTLTAFTAQRNARWGSPSACRSCSRPRCANGGPASWPGRTGPTTWSATGG